MHASFDDNRPAAQDKAPGTAPPAAPFTAFGGSAIVIPAGGGTT
ncbi:MAG: hypothetical protein ACREJM_04100 [Candidatus Saccharimonadales bacterium]